MDMQPSLEFLPFEVLGKIASYLSVPDILACCETSSLLRQAFSDDLVWKKHCNLELVNCLKKSDGHVEPSIEWEEDEQRTLSQVSNWRKCYMMQTRLWERWRYGYFEMEQMELGSLNVVFNDTRVAYFDCDYLFLHTLCINQNRAKDELWDVKSVPFLKSTLNLNVHHYITCTREDFLHIDTYKIVNNKLIVSYFNVVLIYDISLSSLPHLPLDHAFIFHAHEALSKDVDTCDKNHIIQNRFFGQIETLVSSNLFIGASTTLEELGNLTLHIWDIPTGKKMKEEIVPTERIAIAGFRLISSKNEKELILKLRLRRDRYMYHYYGYDLSKLEYNSFLVKHNYCDFLILAGNRAVGVGPRRVYFYSYETSEKMLVKKCDCEILKSTLTVSRNNLLFGTFDNTINVINLSSLETISSFKVGFTIYSLQAICNNFVIINSTNGEVWEVGKSAKKLFKLPTNCSFLAVNQSCTKIALERDNKILILNLW